MKTQDIIKYALMAAAAWLAYVWLRDQGMLAELGILPSVPQVGAGNGGGQQQQQGGGGGQQQQQGGGGGGSTNTNTNTSSSGGGSNTPPGGSTSTGSLKEQLRIASQSAATASGGLMHFWQWNHFLPGNTAKPDPFATPGWEATSLKRQPASIEEVETTPLTLDQYWALVQPVLAPGGVSGVGGSGLRGVNHWGQQPSQWYGQAPNQQGTGMGRVRRGRGDLGGGGF